MNLHDRMTPAEAANLEREVRLVCRHCRRPADRSTSIDGMVFARHANDFDGNTCHDRRGGIAPEWAWTAPRIGGFPMEGPS